VAPDNADGLHAYVITKKKLGPVLDASNTRRPSFAAKASLRLDRERYTAVSVRRALAADVRPSDAGRVEEAGPAATRLPAARDVFLAEHARCQFPGGCVQQSTELHHRAGRRG